MRVAPSQLTIREIIGQLMMPALPDTPLLDDPDEWNRVQEELEAFHFGGYIVFRGDREKTPPYLAELQDISEIPLLFSSDLERGCGQQLKGATEFPSFMALGATRDPDLAFQQGAITALEARQAGIHWIFAPMIDLATRPENPIVNTRALGDEPHQVATLGTAFVQGAQRYKAIACAKHFPGHAETAVDSHETLPTLDVSRQRLETNDLVPFRRAIEAGVKSIMIGHLGVPSLDENGLPATMSKRVVTDLLRGQMGFTGLIVTDALMMGAITERYDPGYAAVKALQAGCDVLLMPPDPQAVVDAVLRAIEEGALSKHRLLESVERIFEAKWQLGLSQDSWEDEDEMPSTLPDYEPAVWAIAESSITLVEDHDQMLPLSADARVMSIVLDDDDDEAVQANWQEAMSRHPEVPVRILTPQSTPEEVAQAVAEAKQYGTALVSAFSAVKAWKNRVDLPAPLSGVPDALRAAGCRVVAASFTSPFLISQFPQVEAYLCAYSAHPLSMKAAVQAIWGELPFQGRLPVALPVLSPRA